MSYTLEPLAYFKAILHAAKHPSATTIGLLVGQFDNQSKTILVQDAIPLLHHWTDLSPMMEVALQLSEIHVRSKGQVFVGVYVANAGLEDVSIPTPVAAVADALRKEVPQALVLVVDNQKLADGSEVAFVPYTFMTKSSWTLTGFSSPTFSLSDPSTPSKTLASIKAGTHVLLGDFDEHLENPRVDFLANSKISW